LERKEKIKKLIAFQDGIVTKEKNLPYPYVFYPGHYGAFIGFAKGKNSTIFFCKCSKKAIENYIRFKIDYDDRMNVDPQRNFILSKAHFPQKIVKNLIEQGVMEDYEIINQLNFRNEICHECNKQTPTYNYCHSMYGGVFEQNYGWYINKQSFEFGVKPVSYKILEDVCPDEVFSLLDVGKYDFLIKYNRFSETDLIISQANDSSFQKNTRKIRKIIENEVRVKFGFRKVGEAWANETLLYQLVCEIYPNVKIIRHYRPDFLDFLELDVYIPHLKVGIEYQGIQHFKAIKYWGGKASLEKNKERDKKKQELCSKNNVKLLYFYYYEELNKESVENKLKSMI